MYQRIYIQDFDTSPLSNCVDLVSATSGSKVVSVTDKIFMGDSYKLNYAPALNSPGGFIGMCIFQYKCLLHQLDPINWIHDFMTIPAFGQCVIKLGSASTIRGFNIEMYFPRNSKDQEASVEGTFSSSNDNLDKAEWVEILPKFQLSSLSHNVLVLDKETDVFTHIRFNEYPCNDVVNFFVYGQPCN